jgi:protein-S-isoprenylcysteine O-methyltransferase Ste14
LIICILFVITGGWIAIEGVKEITLWASETHRTERVVTEGIYSMVRHPQYLGGLLAHFGIFVVPSAWHSNLFTQIISFIIVLISRKEEQELAKEFEDYTYTIKRLCQC